MTVTLGPAWITPGGRFAKGVWHGLPFASNDTVERYITSEFGAHEDFRRERGWQPHQGTDLHAPIGTLLHSLGDGIVELAGRSSMWPVAGIYVQIHHGDGIRTFYLHMSEVAVAVGDTVTRGQFIGKSGNTSSVPTVPHLHLGVNIDDVGDPMKGGRTWVDAEGIVRQTIVSPPQPSSTVPDPSSAPPALERETATEWLVSEYYLSRASQGGTKSMDAPQFVGFAAGGREERWEIRLQRPTAERPTAGQLTPEPE